MKICQVLAGTGKGGLEKHTFELANLLIKKGFDVSVIAHEELKVEFDKNINFIPLDLTKSRNNVFILYKLYKIFKINDFDIIHTQANKATSMVVRLKPFIDSKIISTLHNVKSNLKPFKKAHYVITVSDKIGKKLDIDYKKTIYNGINFQFNKNNKIDLYEKYNIRKNDFIICSVARFTKVKRFDVLIKSLKNLKNVHLILVGSGKEEKVLKELAINLDLINNITFTGVLDNIEAKKIVASSSLFVMTSDNEGFPYTFIESMFCNTPFLSTPISDIKEFIGEKYIVPFGEYNIFNEKIEYIKNNYSKVEYDFKKVFSEAEKKLTVENMVNETINLYKKIGRFKKFT